MSGILKTLCGAALAALIAAGGAEAQDKLTLRFTQPWPAAHPQWVHGEVQFEL